LLAGLGAGVGKRVSFERKLSSGLVLASLVFIGVLLFTASVHVLPARVSSGPHSCPSLRPWSHQ
jgi:hypothetical protein